MPKTKPVNTLQPNVQPSIRLTSFHAIESNFSITPDIWEKYEFEGLKFSLTYDPVIHAERINYFGIVFSFSLQNKEKTMDMSIKYIGHFEVAGIEVSEESLQNPFFKFNAPAILFPYFRNYVSSFFLNAGFKPIILPSFNFHTAKPVNKKADEITVNK